MTRFFPNAILYLKKLKLKKKPLEDIHTLQWNGSGSIWDSHSYLLFYYSLIPKITFYIIEKSTIDNISFFAVTIGRQKKSFEHSWHSHWQKRFHSTAKNSSFS